MKKRLRNFGIMTRDNFANWSGRIKRAEFVSVFISAIVSATAEFFRQSLQIIAETNFLLDATFLQAIREQRLYILHSIFCIFLITAIVWCITGIVEMLKKGAFVKSQMISLSVLLMFAFCVAWYSCEIIIGLNWIKFGVTLIMVIILYTLLFMFFCYDGESPPITTNDYAIAAKRPETKK